MPMNDLDRDDYFCYNYFVVVMRCEMFAYQWQDLYISVPFKTESPERTSPVLLYVYNYTDDALNVL